MPFADQIDVFYGRVSRNSAQLYVRVGSLTGGEEWSIAGRVRGPIARGVRTLPTTVALTDLGQGATLLATCSIPDPSFWTTQLPGTYEVSIQLSRNGEVVESIVRSLGIRFFGASTRKFLWEGKRWVLRGVSTHVSDVQAIDEFGDNVGVIVTKDPSEALLNRASDGGVMVAAELSSTELMRALRSLSRWPAVAIAILPSDSKVDGNLRAAAPNVLLAQRLDLNKRNEIAEWAQVIFCDADDTKAFGEAAKSSPLPFVAQRRLNGNFTLVEARRECDALQRDLAPLGDFAGYVVQI